MAKIVLGKRPEFITRNVSFSMPDGSEATIECRFKYRTRKEFGKFLADMMAPKLNADSDKVTIDAVIAQAVDQNAHYLGEILVGWDLDEELNPESLEQFADELPAGARSIMDAYAGAISEGRLGN